jgi:hypothetical protein
MREKTLPGTSSIVPGLAQMLEDVGLDTALAALDTAFPTVNFTVEVEADGDVDDEDDEDDEREDADLSFTHFLPGGELWLDDNMDTTSLALEGQEFIPMGNAWAAGQAEFNQWLEKAKDDGLLVCRETVDCTADGIEAVRALNALVATGPFQVAVVETGPVTVVHKKGPGQLALLRVTEDGGHVLVVQDERFN